MIESPLIEELVLQRVHKFVVTVLEARFGKVPRDLAEKIESGTKTNSRNCYGRRLRLSIWRRFAARSSEADAPQPSPTGKLQRRGKKRVMSFYSILFHTRGMTT
jgi:hypothetical protein